MNDFFSQIEFISCREIQNYENERKIIYTISENKQEHIYMVLLPKEKRPIQSDFIIFKGKICNGFQLVQFLNKEFGYIRVKDNTLIPNRFDIATNFNSFHLAMVAKDGFVTWIDEYFNHIDYKGKMKKEEGLFTPQDGFQTVYRFSHALSKVEESRYFLYDNTHTYDFKNTYLKNVCYVNPYKEIQEFYKYDGEVQNYRKKIFSKGENFNAFGVSLADDKLLFAEGYYSTLKDIFALTCKEESLNLDEKTRKKLLKKHF